MDKYRKEAMVFRALSDVKRLAIIDLLKNGEKCACVLLEDLDLTQSGLSYHMNILTKSGIVSARQQGKWTYYSISHSGSRKAAKLLLNITGTAKSSE